MCHAYVRGDSLAGVVISDHEYPSRVSHTLITKVLDEFAQKIAAASWPTLTERDVVFPQLNMHLAKYQNPREADAMTKIQEDLDETKIILVSTHNKLWSICVSMNLGDDDIHKFATLIKIRDVKQFDVLSHMHRVFSATQF